VSIFSACSVSVTHGGLKMRLTDIRDGHLLIRQGKTGQVLRIAIEGRLEEPIGRIKARKYKVTEFGVVRNERGEQLPYESLNDRFVAARKLAGVDPMRFSFAICARRRGLK
jgi:hypothetical protein